MRPVSEPYTIQAARRPKSGRQILAQFEAEAMVVYQAYRPAIGHFAARHGYPGYFIRCSGIGAIGIR